MSTTYTFTGTESYSVADVKAVMQNTFEDIVGFANREMVDYDRARKWIEDLTYLLNEKALKAFELQLHHTGLGPKAYRYEVDAFGVFSGQQSGGINYYALPANTQVGLFAELNENSLNYARVLRELVSNRGWGENGLAANGTATHDRSYVSNTLQLKRSEIK